MAALPPRANTTSALPVAPSASSSAPSSSAVSSSLTDKQKEDALFKKFMQERTRKLEELQATHTVLARNVPADADSLAAANHVGRTKAAVAFSLLGDLIDECIYDVLFEAHREMKMASSVCQLCQTKCVRVLKPLVPRYWEIYIPERMPLQTANATLLRSSHLHVSLPSSGAVPSSQNRAATSSATATIRTTCLRTTASIATSSSLLADTRRISRSAWAWRGGPVAGWRIGGWARRLHIHL
ncbi:hypothetical protein BC938DRAFT_482774 [Jimgerdemannia flammicorona]|uniref:Uncharacterized protein n=1 Tax=Jimgerdemannia flammicorona TaxID=994334 RepID=A0A433QD79_9FUNG|nr:hypothetical protein BC938DRAFT_482774 [Jimgerdemannia flammicorona]